MMTDKVEIYRSKRGKLKRTQWRARVITEERKKLFVSSEGYNNLYDLVEITNRLFPNLERVGDPRDLGDTL